MKPNPIQLLVDEHDIISQADEIVNMLKGFMDYAPDKYERIVRSLLRFFKEYCDKCHHYKEEEVLFMELNDHLGFTQSEIVNELVEHHELFRGKVNRIEDTLNTKDYAMSQSYLENFIKELLDHIAVENDELFVMVDSVFSEAEKEIIYHKFKDIDLEFGIEKKEELEKIIDELSAELHLSQV